MTAGVLESAEINRRDPFLTEDGGPYGTRQLPATSILGTPVSLITMAQAVRVIRGWALEGASRMICVRDVHGVMCAVEDARLAEVHQRASMVTPDGMPLAKISRWRGHRTTRVSGPTLVEEMCRATRDGAVRHFFFGGKEGVADEMAAELSRRFPGVAVAGTLCPPFGAVSAEQDAGMVEAIRAARPNILWVGMSTPKQDFWMDEHRDALPGMVMIGVGAAFDFHAGAVKRAPLWMQNAGLEWLHRLGSEPRRLWRRYLLMAPAFVWRMARTRSR